MDLQLTGPAPLFPSYDGRFFALARLIRDLRAER